MKKKKRNSILRLYLKRKNRMPIIDQVTSPDKIYLFDVDIEYMQNLKRDMKIWKKFMPMWLSVCSWYAKAAHVFLPSLFERRLNAKGGICLRFTRVGRPEASWLVITVQIMAPCRHGSKLPSYLSIVYGSLCWQGHPNVLLHFKHSLLFQNIS